MDQQTDSSGSEHTNSKLKIVLVGYNESGKSSSGNTILGSDEFDLKKNAECVKKEGVVTGRKISVIDTPGRHRDYTAQDTPKLYKQEVVRSVTLCPPGPHALLLNINTQIQFVEACKDAVIEHLQLFGETVWKHIIVLFTHRDQLEHKDIQQHIQDEGEPLQCILEKCGNRFHVFNNKVKGDSTQVAELLKKIDEMVAENHGCHFALDKENLNLLTQKKRVYEELRRNKEQQCRENMQVKMANEHKLTEQRIVLLGRESAGKTSAADAILNSQEFDLKTTLVSRSREVTIGRWQVTVVDTPGWVTNDPSQTPTYIRQGIVHSVSVCSPGLHAFLLVIPANMTFTKADETAMSEHLELLGDRVWNHSIVLFTCADWMGDSPIELYMESEGEPLSRIIKKCGNRYHAISNMSQDQNQVETLLEKIEVMVAGDSNCFYEMDEQTQKNIADEGHKDEDKNTDTTFQLPIGDSKEVLGQRKRKHKSISTFDASSGYGTGSLSECGSKEEPGPSFST